MNQRQRRALGCAPVDRVHADTAAMLPLPPVAPATGWRHSTRLPRDHYVRLDGNDYSVHPAVIGRRVEVVADLDRVRACCEGRLVADHARVWARHQSLTDPEHDTRPKQLRRTGSTGRCRCAEPERAGPRSDATTTPPWALGDAHRSVGHGRDGGLMPAPTTPGRDTLIASSLS